MTVTVIQIGLDPDVIDYSSPDFAQFARLSKDVLRAANNDNVAGVRAAGYQSGLSTPGDMRRWYPEPEGAIR